MCMMIGLFVKHNSFVFENICKVCWSVSRVEPVALLCGIVM